MTRKEFIKFLKEFKTDFDQNKENWKNDNLSDFLGSMIAYTEEIQSFHDEIEMDINTENLTWKKFSHILEKASVYE